MTAVATTASPAANPARRTSAGFVTASLAVADRTLRKFMRTPALVVVSTIQGGMFLLIFRYVFGGAINTGGLRYVDFLVPGFVMTSVLFTGMNSASGIAEDLEAGFFDRLRSLPMPRASVIAGRVLGDTAMLVWGLAVTTAIGFAVGFRIHAPVSHALVAFALCALFGFVFCWLFMALGLLAGNAQAAQGLSMLVFPLTFVSSAYVPVRTMPSWMRPIANHQPITVMTDAVRSLSEGHHVTSIGSALAWSVGLVAVFAPVAVARFRRG